MTSSVGKRVIFLFFVVLLTLLANNVVLLHHFSKTETYGPFLELAGRQRFLAQKLGSLIERRRWVQDTQTLPAIEATMMSFNKSLSVLEHGGEILGRSYPPAPPEMAEAIRVQRAAWRTLKSHFDEELADRGNPPWPSHAAGKAETLVEELTGSAFALVEEFENWRQKLRHKLLYSFIGTSLLALVTLLASLRLAWSKVVTPVRELRDEVLRVSENASYRNSVDELGLVSTVVTEMSEDVGRLRNEREQVKEELRRIEADYESVFDNAVAGIFQFNAAGELILANPAMARILGYASPGELAESIRNVHVDMFADPEHESRVQALKEQQGTIESQTQMLRKDGSLLWALESSAIVRRMDSDYCCESVVVDVTEMKKAQEGLRELSGLLLDSQEHERRRIARELHDSTGQLLAALEMNVSRVKEFLGGALDTISQTGDLARECSREIRSMSYLLHPPLLDELGLVYALREYADGFAKRAGIDVDLDLPSEMERLSRDSESALFRVVQEALTNIHRHAESPVARLRLNGSSDAVVVEVEDEGCGIPPELLGSGCQPLGRMGVGMRGMEERLRQLGGRLTVTSHQNGTVVRAELPRRAPAADIQPLVDSAANQSEEITGTEHGRVQLPASTQ